MRPADRIVLRNPIFVPGNRRDMLEKAAGFKTDAVVPDLEDAVPPGEKDAARDTVAGVTGELAGAGHRVIVRINSLDTGMAEDDVAAVAGPDVYGISVGKVTRPADVSEYDRILSAAEANAGMEVGSTKLLPWIETAAAVYDARAVALASERVIAIVFGAEDYTRDVGVRRTESGEEIEFARGMVALAAHAAGVTPLDTPFVRFRDGDGLKRDAAQALRMGYKGKFAIHPAQLEAIRTVFGPQPEEVEHARRVIQAWERAAAAGRGTLDLDGEMVDAPVVERARNLLAQAAETGAD